jgi:hypothetical protein
MGNCIAKSTVKVLDTSRELDLVRRPDDAASVRESVISYGDLISSAALVRR